MTPKFSAEELGLLQHRLRSYLVVLRYWAASRAAYGFVLTPFITVMLSAWLDDEPIHVGLILGGLLVLAGVYVGVLRPSRVPSAPPPA